MKAAVFSLLLGMQRLDREVFGSTNNPFRPVPKMRLTDPPKVRPAQGRCLCRNPMPLTRTERDLLAGFPPGRAKKRFVRELKIRYGKV